MAYEQNNLAFVLSLSVVSDKLYWKVRLLLSTVHVQIVQLGYVCASRGQGGSESIYHRIGGLKVYGNDGKGQRYGSH